MRAGTAVDSHRNDWSELSVHVYCSAKAVLSDRKWEVGTELRSYEAAKCHEEGGLKRAGGCCHALLRWQVDMDICSQNSRPQTVRSDSQIRSLSEAGEAPHGNSRFVPCSTAGEQALTRRRPVSLPECS